MSSPSTNYFELFGLEASFSIDTNQLEERYHQLQIENHPDKFAAAGEPERMRAVQVTSLLNGAFDTLRSPLSRAGYLLEQAGFDTEKVTQADLGMDLLMEQMQMREALDELPKDESSLTALDGLKKQVKDKIRQRELSFVALIDSDDLQAAKRVFHEMQFLFKFLSEVEAGEELRLGY